MSAHAILQLVLQKECNIYYAYYFYDHVLHLISLLKKVSVLDLSFQNTLLTKKLLNSVQTLHIHHQEHQCHIISQCGLQMEQQVHISVITKF